MGSRSVPETPSTVGENRTMNEASRGIANLLENFRVKSPGGPACNARSSRPYSPPDEWIKRNRRKKKVLVTPKSRSTKVQMFHYDGVSFSSHSKLGFERCIIHNIPPPKKPQSYGAHGKMLRPKWLWWIWSRKSSQVKTLPSFMWKRSQEKSTSSIAEWWWVVFWEPCFFNGLSGHISCKMTGEEVVGSENHPI